MKLDDITPIVLTMNEEANIERVLGSVAWARRIVVVDSGSTDATAELVAGCRNAELLRRDFDSHTSQWNYGVDQVRTPWALALDADYVCPSELETELRELVPQHDTYDAEFIYAINGRPLRGSLYPPRAVLFRADRLRYRQDGHTQILDVSGPDGKLHSRILHDDRKPLARWLANQAKYADLEVEKLMSLPEEALNWKDRLRQRILPVPLLTFLYCMVYKRLVLDGWAGLYYSLQRVYAELLLSLKLLDAHLRRTPTAPGSAGGKDDDALSSTENPRQSPPQPILDRGLPAESAGQSQTTSSTEPTA